MKRCPTCNRTYADLSLNFCLDDGTPLTSDDATTTDLNATVRYPPPRDTSEPPPTEIYRPAPVAPTPRPTSPPPPPPPPQQWTPPPPAAREKRSNAIWWVLGVLLALLVVGVGVAAVFIALSLTSTVNRNGNANTREVNRNVNANANVANTNVNTNTTVSPPALMVDDFSEKKWSTASSQFGRTWYTNDEYHMSSKERMFVVMYAPT